MPAAPARRPPSDPAPLHSRAVDDLSFIRRTMEGAAAFTDVAGWGLTAIGITALAAAALAEQQPTAGRWLAVWLAEAVIAATIGGVTTWRKMQRHPRPAGAPLLSPPARKFFFGFWPAILAGAALTFALLDMNTVWQQGSQIPRVIPGLWLLLYGVGITTAGAFSVRALPVMGFGFMALGMLALAIRAIPSALILALGFGLWQIAVGIWIARRHGG